MLNRGKFLGLKPSVVELPFKIEDEPAYIRAIPLRAIQTWLRSYGSLSGTSDPRAIEGIAAIVVLGLCDHNGTQLLTEEDVQSVMNVDFGLVKKIAEKIMDHNAMTTAGQEALEGNSSATGSDNSPSASQGS